jgi:uncharacterized protein YggE
MKRRLNVVVLSCAAAMLVLTGCNATTTGKERGPREITVTGVAEIKVPPDHVVIHTSVVNEAMDGAEAQAKTDQAARTVLALVRGQGIPTQDVRTEHIYLSTKERWDDKTRTSVFEGYRASNSIEVTLRDLSKYDALMAAMLKQGVNRINGVTFASASEIEKRREARILAIQMAKQKADYLAAQVGMKVGKPLSIAEERRDPMARGQNYLSNAAVAYRPDAPTDAAQGAIAPGAITIRMQVEVSFELVE